MYTTIESKMIFGPFEEADVFEIEKSNVNQLIGEHIRTVEFILCREQNQILFVEAKSSSPQERTDKERYEKFIGEIAEKFVQSFEIYQTLRCDRYSTEKSIGEHLKQQEWDKVEIKFVLVIHGHQKEWLAPLRETLMKSMSTYLKIWKSTVIVLNDEMAERYHLISGTV